MKLELKHLANYLPYGLKVLVDTSKWFEKREPFVAELIGLLGLKYLTVEYIDESGTTLTDNMGRFKPILRPLSDLTKPCLEGRKVPLMELCKMAYDNHKNFRQRGNVIEILSGEYALYNFYWQKNGFVTIHISDKMARVIPNQIDLFSYLFENHLDIYSLIQNGLAIDINTIKEEK